MLTRQLAVCHISAWILASLCFVTCAFLIVCWSMAVNFAREARERKEKLDRAEDFLRNSPLRLTGAVS
jgi:hypothetical protein